MADMSIDYKTEEGIHYGLNFDIANECYLKVMRNIRSKLAENIDLVDFSLADFQDKTALIIAAKIAAANSEVLDFFLNDVATSYPEKVANFNLNAQDEDGLTALHYLCAYGMQSQALRLVELGASVNIADNLGLTPLDYLGISDEQLDFMLHTISIDSQRDTNALSNSQMDSCFDYDGGFLEKRKASPPSDKSVLEACRERLASISAGELMSKGFKHGDTSGNISRVRSSDRDFWSNYVFLRQRNIGFGYYRARCEFNVAVEIAEKNKAENNAKTAANPGYQLTKDEWDRSMPEWVVDKAATKMTAVVKGYLVRKECERRKASVLRVS